MYRCDAKPGTDDSCHLLFFPDCGHKCCGAPPLPHAASQEPHTAHSTQYCSLLKHAKEEEKGIYIYIKKRNINF